MSSMKKGVRYLRNPLTGVVFIWTEILAKRTDLKEYVPGRDDRAAVPMPPDDSQDETVTAAPAGQADEFNPEMIVLSSSDDSETITAISDASKTDIADYCEKHFGERPDLRKSRNDLESFLRQKIADHGHPDAP